MADDDDRVLLCWRASSGWSVVLEQAHGCVYAYLRDPDDNIVSACWLYNLFGHQGPADVPGSELGEPLRNAAGFASDEAHLDAHLVHTLDVRWAEAGDAADIVMAGTTIGTINARERMGRSLFAIRDSAVARRLVDAG